ncbi:MAG: hypothetical protein HC834_02930 [Rhodospirillales bacterium]|nr:hypothetical protein [Rhodospirillales bacterium]
MPWVLQALSELRDIRWRTLYTRACQATGVFLALCAALVIEGNFLFLHLLLAFWVLAHLVEIGSQVVLYQRGV